MLCNKNVRQWGTLKGEWGTACRFGSPSTTVSHQRKSSRSPEYCG